MDWKKEYSEGLQFASTAKGMQNKEKVDNETLYNIIALAIEKFTSSLASKLNYIPMNSSLVFIFRELSGKINIPAHFIDEASFMNRFMIYCSLDIVPVKAISKADVLRMIAFMDEVASYTEKQEGAFRVATGA
ncbi:MAG: hypothetical protein JXR71_07540 [Bacteroidales bacterium]|nr:hypothetical protein [Bacteroidales bacterium]